MYFLDFTLPFSSATKRSNEAIYKIMPSSIDEESLLSSDTLLEKNQSTEVHYKDLNDECPLPLSKEQRWKEYLPGRRALLTHAIVLAIYWSVTAFVFDRIANHYEHGPDYTYCKS